MKRPWLVWVAFSLCVASAAWAMARLGGAVLRLERAEAGARRRAELEETLQLALWRMDSALAPLIAEESARPYFAYNPFFPAERAYTSMFAEIQKGDVLVPSPLLTYNDPRVRLHFQLGPDRRVTSPQVPVGNMRDLCEDRYVPAERLEASARRLAELAEWMDAKALAEVLAPAPPARPGAGFVLASDENPSSAKASNEYRMRSKGAQLAQNVKSAQAVPLQAATSVEQGPLQAAWVGPVLVLARQVRVESGTFLQGCWLDWNAIRAELLANVADLLPGSDLEPVRPGGTPTSPTRMLAALPARLVPRMPAPAAQPGASPVRLALRIAWGGLALAAVAVALLLHGAMALSARRGTFVSAVTHELRTPMTTVRLYAEMLSEGMVADPESRRSYLATLRAEADRLGHLIENVLAYARLERGRKTERREVLSPTELLSHIAPSLDARARQAGMTVVLDDTTPAGARLRTDASAVGQILLNLVDNASKYAGSSEDRRIHIDARAEDHRLELAVRDHGPGIVGNAARRLFRPFSKSARDAAASAPGVGLGLALSRRLARDLGGDLRLCRENGAGACFVVTLPLESDCPRTHPSPPLSKGGAGECFPP
jgi:signal transduction histidine kinase